MESGCGKRAALISGSKNTILLSNRRRPFSRSRELLLLVARPLEFSISSMRRRFKFIKVVIKFVDDDVKRGVGGWEIEAHLKVGI